MAEWIAFAGLEGLGQEREDFRAGQICSTLKNIQRTKEDDKVWEPGDFFPSLNHEQQDEEQEVLLLEDKEAQSNLIMASIFGKTA